MKTRLNTAAWAAICAIMLTVQPLSWGQDAVQPSAETKAADELPRENVRLVLEIATPNRPTATFAIVSNGQKCMMDNLAEIVQFDDSQAPVIMNFQANIVRTGESTYNVEYTYGLQVPMVIQARVANQSSPQVMRSTYQYKDIGTQSTVSMDIGQKLELFHDPQRTVTLELQRVDTNGTADINPFLGSWQTEFQGEQVGLIIDENGTCILSDPSDEFTCPWRLEGDKMVIQTDIQASDDSQLTVTALANADGTLTTHAGDDPPMTFHRVK